MVELMKLILCIKCQDVIKLQAHHRNCLCGESYGQYFEDGLNAVIKGPCIPLGIDNKSLLRAIYTQPLDGRGQVFEAFIIPQKCPTINYGEQHHPADILKKKKSYTDKEVADMLVAAVESLNKCKEDL